MEQQKGLDFGPGAEKPKPQRRTWTVSQLTDRLQGVLETEFFDVWVEGEVSNVTMPASGHWYFSLKDEAAQLRCAMFRQRNILAKFTPRDGSNWSTAFTRAISPSCSRSSGAIFVGTVGMIRCRVLLIK